MNAAFGLILGMLALGKLMSRSERFPERSADALNQFVINICLPALILVHVPALEFEVSMLKLVAVPWLLALLLVLLVLGLSRLLAWDRSSTAVVLMCTVLGNTSFLGYPLTVALLGEQALGLSVVYDQLGTFMLLSSFGITVLAMAEDGQRPGLRSMARRVLGFPPFIALLLALASFGLPAAFGDALRAHGILEPLQQMLRVVGGALVPVAMFAIGMQLRFRIPTAQLMPLGAGLVIKLAIAPLLALLIAQALGLSGDLFRVAVFESAMPTMATAGVLCIAAGLKPMLAAAMVGYSILISVASLPLITAWLS
jgi:predicted permease